MMKIYGIILAGGTGTRSGADVPKQFLDLGGRPILAWSLEKFSKSPHIDNIIIVSHEDFISTVKDIVQGFHFSKVINVIAGGKTRQGSSYQAITSSKFHDDDILIFHDAARPFVTDRIIEDCIMETHVHGAAAAYVKSIDTIADIEDGFVISIPPRKNLYCTQTPQAFKFYLIKDAHSRASLSGLADSTDDVSLAIDSGYRVRMVEGDYANIKITTPHDYETALSFLTRNLS